ncbi:hypothetical protein [Aliiroseovarius crassostreae]|nr:hypothetical protein [Aliiroseovarius crassostreae]UWQ05528.1 hypothetical protein K3X22_03480 [Aliiroseovarius crassostreae]
MTNQIAFSIAFVILVALGLDYALSDLANSLFLGRKFLELTEWMAFWR